MIHNQYIRSVENRIGRKTEMLSNCTESMARSLESKDVESFREQSLLAAKWSEEVLSLRTVLSIVQENVEDVKSALWLLNQAQQDDKIRPQDAGEAIDNMLLAM